MQTVYLNKLKPFLDAVAEQMDLYIPKKVENHFVFNRYDPASKKPVELNNIRVCTPTKEFLFPFRELAAIFPDDYEPEEIKPFAVFGLKDCDLRSIEVLDTVFMEEEFEDPFYIKRREKMFIISSDCFDPADSCFCNVLSGKPYAETGFDLNVSQISDGFIIEVGSEKGHNFIKEHSELFSDAGDDQLSQRQEVRNKTQQQLEQNNSDMKFGAPIKEIVESGRDGDVYDGEALTCVECQACTRVCPTCHCFYLFDTKQKEYFGKMKMWDSCMRMAYAEVAGGANPRKILGERLRHRFMHKFSYFLERYGIDMCVGCGRCVDAEAGRIDIREVLKKLSKEFECKDKAQSKVVK